MMDKELLNIADTLLEYKRILCRVKIYICTDYQNLIHLNIVCISTKVHWHYLILEELVYVNVYIPGKKNKLADILL